MRAVVQRVSHASVSVEGNLISEIDQGFLVLLGVGQGDTSEDAKYLADKISNLRVFDDEQGKMNLSIKDSGGRMLVVSQFTLFGDCRKGRRPSFSQAGPSDLANTLYEEFIVAVRAQGIDVRTGQFQTHMAVSLLNDGPVTMLLDSKGVF